MKPFSLSDRIGVFGEQGNREIVANREGAGRTLHPRHLGIAYHWRRMMRRSYALCVGLTLGLLLCGIHAEAKTIYVSQSGNDANSGSSWAQAKQTVQAGINAAFASDQVWVVQGTYTLAAPITVGSGIAVYGGFKGNETSLGQRDFVHNITLLDGNSVTGVVQVNTGTAISTTVDGFTIRNAKNAAAVNCLGSMTVSNNVIVNNSNLGILVNSAGSVVISNNSLDNNTRGGIGVSAAVAVITNNTVTNSNGSGARGVYLNAGNGSSITATVVGNTVTGSANDGIDLSGASSTAVTDNTISGNVGIGIFVSGTATLMNNTVSQNATGVSVFARSTVTLTSNEISANSASGITCEGAVAIITDNTITGNAAVQSGAGMDLFSSTVTIERNLIAYNSAGGSGGGCYLANDSGTVNDNLFAANTSGFNGGGLCANVTYPLTVANNTFVNNAAGSTQWGGGLYVLGLSTGASFAIANNVIAFNSSGIDVSGTTLPTLTTNCVYGSTYNNYDGLPPGGSDIQVDPRFIDFPDDDFHLATGSPCIDTGTDSFVSTGDTDLDGNPRIYGAHVDMGAYEWIPSAYPDLKSLSVSPPTLSLGQSATTTVILTGKALSPGAVVSLALSDPNAATIPAWVTVPPGSSSATFSVTANSLAAPETLTLQATYRGVTQSATITVLPLLGSLTLNPAAVTLGTSTTGTVTLNAPAPAGGVTVALSSNDANLSMLTSVGIAAGKTSATFTIGTGNVTATTTDTITASYAGASVSATLSINPTGTVQSVSVVPSTVTGSLSAVGVVTLSALAPQGGLAVALSSSASGTAAVPATVVVPAGKRSAQFVISTAAVSKATPVTITAAAGGVKKTARLNVVPVTIASLSVVPSAVNSGDNSVGIVQLTIPAPMAVTVTLSSSKTTVAAPDVTSIVIPAGATQATFNISTIQGSVTLATPVVITAAAYGASKSAKLTVSP